jgi:hypothetical protein
MSQSDGRRRARGWLRHDLGRRARAVTVTGDEHREIENAEEDVCPNHEEEDRRERNTKPILPIININTHRLVVHKMAHQNEPNHGVQPKPHVRDVAGDVVDSLLDCLYVKAHLRFSPRFYYILMLVTNPKHSPN